MGPQVTAASFIFILLQKSSSPLLSDRSRPLLSNESNQISFCVSLTSHLLIFKANVQFDCVWPNNEIYMFKTLSKYLWTFEDSGHKVLAGYGPRKPSENFPSQVPIKVPGKGPKFSLGGIMPRHGNLVPTSWSTGFVGWSIILSYLTLSNHWERLQLTRLKNKSERAEIGLTLICWSFSLTFCWMFMKYRSEKVVTSSICCVLMFQFLGAQNFVSISLNK